MESVSFGATIVDGEQVTTAIFVAVDGGPIDEDRAANAEIVDPSGPAIHVDDAVPGALAFRETSTSVSLVALMTLLVASWLLFFWRKRRDEDEEVHSGV